MTTPIAGSVALRPVLLRRASDARLARLAAAGNEAAIAAIFDRYHQALHRYCFSILGNGHDAADALQNTMVKALHALPGETREIAVRPWLYRVAHNESISLLRARRADAGLDAAAGVGDLAAAGLIDSRQDLRELSEDLGELTERQRGALLMRELGGLEFAEVANALGTSPAAVKQSVYEARCALQAMAEGRAMSCDAIRRAISDSDRRVLRGARIRGHLRDCAGCRDFELALHARPAQLTAMIPPLPVAVAAAMLHGGLGIGGGGTGGGGLAAGLAGGAKATTGLTLGAKAAGIVAVTATLGGGAAYVVPAVRDASSPARPAAQTAPAPASAATVTPATAVRTSATAASAVRHAAASAARRSSSSPGAAPAGTGNPASTHGATQSSAARGRPAATPARKAASVSRGKSALAAARKRAAHARRPSSSASATRRPAPAPAKPSAASQAPVTPPMPPVTSPAAKSPVVPGPASAPAPAVTPGPGAAASGGP